MFISMKLYAYSPNEATDDNGNPIGWYKPQVHELYLKLQDILAIEYVEDLPMFFNAELDWRGLNLYLVTVKDELVNSVPRINDQSFYAQLDEDTESFLLNQSRCP